MKCKFCKAKSWFGKPKHKESCPDYYVDNMGVNGVEGFVKNKHWGKPKKLKVGETIIINPVEGVDYRDILELAESEEQRAKLETFEEIKNNLGKTVSKGYYTKEESDALFETSDFNIYDYYDDICHHEERANERIFHIVVKDFEKARDICQGQVGKTCRFYDHTYIITSVTVKSHGIGISGELYLLIITMRESE